MTGARTSPGHLAREFLDVLAAVPLFVSAPLCRPWHLRWGATDEEVRATMPGDDLVPHSSFTATRAVTVDAPPSRVWPWITQVGFGRAGFYSYDLLDNLGHDSAQDERPEWQAVHVGDLAAPMTNPPTTDTSFTVHSIEPERYVVWAKPDSTWTWLLTSADGRHTRLVTRIRQHYPRKPAAIVTILLCEIGDFPMMRRMLLGIKRRAEQQPIERGPGVA